MFMNLGLETGDKATDDSHTRYLQTMGTYLTYKNSNWNLDGAFYYQMGKNKAAEKVSALMGSIQAAYTFNQTWGAVASFDYLSGDKGNGGKYKAFDPLYGTHHKFYGAMDYFYASTFANGYAPGLMDARIGGRFRLSGKVDMELNYHYFSTAVKVQDLKKSLGSDLCSILLIFLLDWRMGLAALVTIPLGTLFFAAMMRGYGPRMENYMRSANEMNSALVEYVNGIQVIKAFNRSAASYGKYADSVRYFHDSTMAWWSQCWLWNAAARAVLPSTLLGTLPVGAWLYMEGSLSLHVFLVALVVPLGFIAPLMKVSEAMEQVSMIKGNLEQVTAFLKTPELVRPTEPAELGERCYQFEDVHFAYNEAEILHGISFQTQPGTMTAIVGPSGSGKSTIAKLMAGFWDVTSGTVHFGGQDIRSIPFGQLMGEISYVAQDNFLFDKSIRENIRMGNPDASDEEVEAAAKAANCHDFIMQLEQGYDTMAGDAGASPAESGSASPLRGPCSRRRPSLFWTRRPLMQTLRTRR